MHVRDLRNDLEHIEEGGTLHYLLDFLWFKRWREKIERSIELRD